MTKFTEEGTMIVAITSYLGIGDIVCLDCYAEPVKIRNISWNWSTADFIYQFFDDDGDLTCFGIESVDWQRTYEVGNINSDNEKWESTVESDYAVGQKIEDIDGKIGEIKDIIYVHHSNVFAYKIEYENEVKYMGFEAIWEVID